MTYNKKLKKKQQQEEAENGYVIVAYQNKYKKKRNNYKTNIIDFGAEEEENKNTKKITYSKKKKSDIKNEEKSSESNNDINKNEDEKKEKYKNPNHTALTRAIFLLSRREYSQKELRDYLIRKDFPEEEIEKTLNILIERGYQSDERASKVILNSSLNKKYGPKRVAQNAKMKGIPEEMIEKTIEDSEQNWKENALNAAIRKYGNLPFDNATQVKVASFLARRGYDLDLCWSIAKMKNIDEIDEG